MFNGWLRNLFSKLSLKKKEDFDEAALIKCQQDIKEAVQEIKKMMPLNEALALIEKERSKNSNPPPKF